MFTMGSLFDGIGGFPFAAMNSGIMPIWASEIEAFPMEVTKIRFPNMIHVGDITKLDGAKLPFVDVICGGSPCQDLSIAGNRARLAGARSGLFIEQTRITKEMRKANGERNSPDYLIRPRYLVWENVPGAFSSTEGEDFHAVLEEIVRIKDSACDVPRPDAGRWESAGIIVLGDEFSLAWRVLDAQYWGVAQRRRRIFLVADFGGLTAPKILFEQDSLFGDTTKGQGAWEGTATSVKECTDDTIENCLATPDLQIETYIFENYSKDGRYNGPLGVAPTLAARMGTGGNNVPLVSNPIIFSLDSKASNSMKSSNTHSGCRQTDTARTIDTSNPDPSKNQGGIAILQEAICIAGNTIDRQPQNGGNGIGYQSDISYTITATDHHAVFNRQGYSGFNESEVAGTQCARQNKDATDIISTYQEVDIDTTAVFGGTGYADFAEGISTLKASGGTNGGGSQNLAVERNLVRRLTPLECERLQGFPDGWTLIPRASDAVRYKALGNSVAIPCVNFILHGIAYFLQKIYEKKEE